MAALASRFSLMRRHQTIMSCTISYVGDGTNKIHVTVHRCSSGSSGNAVWGQPAPLHHAVGCPNLIKCTVQAGENAQLELEAGEGGQDEEGGKDQQASEAPQQEQQQDQPEPEDAGPKEEADAKQSFTQPEVSPGWGFSMQGSQDTAPEDLEHSSLYHCLAVMSGGQGAFTPRDEHDALNQAAGTTGHQDLSRTACTYLSGPTCSE